MLPVIYVGQVPCAMSESDQILPFMAIPAMIQFLLSWMIPSLAWKEWKLGEFFFSSHFSTIASPIHVPSSTGLSLVMILTLTRGCGLLNWSATGGENLMSKLFHLRPLLMEHTFYLSMVLTGYPMIFPIMMHWIAFIPSLLTIILIIIHMNFSLACNYLL